MIGCGVKDFLREVIVLPFHSSRHRSQAIGFMNRQAALSHQVDTSEVDMLTALSQMNKARAMLARLELRTSRLLLPGRRSCRWSKPRHTARR